MKIVQLNLAKLRGFTIRDIKGRSGPIKCAIIPLGMNPWIYVPEDGKYAIIDMVENKLKEPDKFGHSSILKAFPKKSVMENMSEEERFHLPILGNCKFISVNENYRRPSSPEPRQSDMPDGISSVLEDDDDLPF